MISKRLRIYNILVTGFCAMFLFSCNGSNPANSNGGNTTENSQVTVNTAITYQTMVGFGGALTWYSDRLVTSAKQDTISKLLFRDMGTDIIRLENWYYPLGYPANKSTGTMVNSGTKNMFDDTNTIYKLARQYDPNIKVLLTSWGPPDSLKSNGELEDGTLRKNSSGFMYQAFADYWTDILNHISFDPDYISIQNEPSFVTSQWTTCKWGATESDSLPGYAKAFDMVYNQIKNRANPPKLIGPESPDISNSFDSFADVLKNRSYLAMYAYHTYNFSSNTQISQTTPLLKSIHDNYGNKPNIMTEYSGMPWFKTAEFINNVLVQADASGYIYWEMVWDSGDSNAMIGIDNAGNFTVTPFYYVMKHFAKYISAGYKRIDVTSTNSDFMVSGFINPSHNQLTLILINTSNIENSVDLSVTGKTITSIKAVQSIQGDYYQQLNNADAKSLNVPGQSITTVVLNIG